jgi:hypothetical protein
VSCPPGIRFLAPERRNLGEWARQGAARSSVSQALEGDLNDDRAALVLPTLALLLGTPAR